MSDVTFDQEGMKGKSFSNLQGQLNLKIEIPSEITIFFQNVEI